MNYSETHREIVEACRKGERQAQYRLYQLYAKAMYNICLRMLNNPNDAEDLLQESFVDIFTKLDYFKYQSSIGAWIKRIVINNCINFLKKRRLPLTDMKAFEERVTEKDNTILSEPMTLSVESIKVAAEQLATGYRIILNLYLFEGYDHREIAEILDINENTSKSQYSRAKKRLREIINTQLKCTQ